MKNLLFSMLALATVCLLAGNNANAQVITHYQPKQNVKIPSSVKVKHKLSIDESKYKIKKMEKRRHTYQKVSCNKHVRQKMLK